MERLLLEGGAVVNGDFLRSQAAPLREMQLLHAESMSDGSVVATLSFAESNIAADDRHLTAAPSESGTILDLFAASPGSRGCSFADRT